MLKLHIIRTTRPEESIEKWGKANPNVIIVGQPTVKPTVKPKGYEIWVWYQLPVVR